MNYHCYEYVVVSFAKVCMVSIPMIELYLYPIGLNTCGIPGLLSPDAASENDDIRFIIIQRIPSMKLCLYWSQVYIKSIIHHISNNQFQYLIHYQTHL